MILDGERPPELDALAYLARSREAGRLAAALEALLQADAVPWDIFQGAPVYGEDVTAMLARSRARKKPAPAPLLAVGMLTAMANAAVAWPLHSDGSGVAFELARRGRVESSRHGPRGEHRPNKVHPAPRRLKSGRYVVRAGDSLWAISSRLLGSGERWRELWRWNRPKIANPNLIFPGEVLELQRRMVAHRAIPQHFNGHRRVAGSFYAHRGGRLVWADTGAAVQTPKREKPRAGAGKRTGPARKPARKDTAAQPATGAIAIPPLVAAATGPAAAERPGKTGTVVTAATAGATLGEVSGPPSYDDLHALRAQKQNFEPSWPMPSPTEAAGLSLLLPGSGQLLEQDWAGGAVDLALEGAALAAIVVAGHSPNSASIVTFGEVVLAANHVLSPMDAYARAQHPR